MLQTIYKCKNCKTTLKISQTTAFCECRFYRILRFKKLILEYDKVRVNIDGLKAIADNQNKPLLFVGEGVEIAPAQGDRVVVTLGGEPLYGCRLVSFA